MYKCSKTGAELAHPETLAELEKELAKSGLDEGSKRTIRVAWKRWDVIRRAKESKCPLCAELLALIEGS